MVGIKHFGKEVRKMNEDYMETASREMFALEQNHPVNSNHTLRRKQNTFPFIS